jgi:hypothetical protein
VTVRGLSNTIFSAGTIGNVTTSKDQSGSMLLAGYDMGRTMPRVAETTGRSTPQRASAARGK